MLSSNRLHQLLVTFLASLVVCFTVVSAPVHAEIAWAQISSKSLNYTFEYPTNSWDASLIYTQLDTPLHVIKEHAILEGENGAIISIDTWRCDQEDIGIHSWIDKNNFMLRLNLKSAEMTTATKDNLPAFLFDYSSETGQAYDSRIVFFKKAQKVVRLTYLMVDGGLSSDTFSHVIDSFDFDNGSEPFLKHKALDQSHKDSTGSRVSYCGGETDDCFCAADNPYPCCSNIGTNNGNCTWWAWDRACCNWEVGLPSPWRDAQYWASDLAGHGYPVSSVPAVGTIGCSSQNHVAWVLEVNNTTNEVYVSEMQCYSSVGVGHRWLPFSFFDNGYIYQLGSNPGESYTANYVQQAPYPNPVLRGQSYEWWIEFQNTGTATWTPDQVLLGTGWYNEVDIVYPIHHSSWLSPTRPTALDQPSVAPGEVGRFSFTFTVPANAALGESQHYLVNPVAEWITWMRRDDGALNGAYMIFNVVEPGYASVSQGVSFSPANPVVGENISASFSLNEVQGRPIHFEEIALAIHNAAQPDVHIRNIGLWQNVYLNQNQTWSRTASTSLADIPPGDYIIVVKGRVNTDWFTFSTTGGANNPVYFTITEPSPFEPSALTATTISESEIALNWTDNADNEDEFLIYRDGTQIATVGANVTTYTDTGLQPDTQYCYTVTASNASGESEPSNESCATTDALPDAVILTLSDGEGGPGSTGNVVSLALDNQSQNTTAVGGLQLTLTYDSQLVTCTDVTAVGRAADFATTLTPLNPGEDQILVYDSSGGSIPSGNDVILDLTFDVAVDAVIGGSTLLALSNALVSDSAGDPIPVDFSDTGMFTVIQPYDPGDINGDGGAPNIFDLITLINIINNQVDCTTITPVGACDRADLNGDGAYNIFDVVALVNLINNPGAFVVQSVDDGFERSGSQGAESRNVTLTGFGSITVAPGESGILNFYMENDEPISGIQLRYTLDTTQATVSGSNLVDRAVGFDLAGPTIVDDTDPTAVEYQVLIYSSSGETIAAGSGDIAEFTVQMDAAALGCSPVAITQLLVSDPTGQPIVVDEIVDGQICVPAAPPQLTLTTTPDPLEWTLIDTETASGTLNLANNGGETLVVSDISADVAWIANISQTSLDIPASSAMDVTFDVTNLDGLCGDLNGTITIVSNDPNEPALAVPVVVHLDPCDHQVFIPDLTAAPDTIDVPIRCNFDPNAVNSYNILGFSYDPSYLQFVELISAGTMTENWLTPEVNADTPGLLNIADFNLGAPLDAAISDTLIMVRFAVQGCDIVVPLHIDQVYFNSQPIPTQDGSVTVPGGTISGTVSICETNQVVPDVTMNYEVGGSPLMSATTDAGGAYVFDPVCDFPGTLVPYHAPLAWEFLTPGPDMNDASQILQRSVQMITFDDCQELLADVNGDGIILAHDAFLTAAWASNDLAALAAPQNQPNYTGEFRFFPETMAVTESGTTYDFEAGIAGDVNRNWTPSANTRDMQTLDGVTVRPSDCSANPQQVMIPIVVDQDLTDFGLYSFQGSLPLNAWADSVSVETIGTLAENFEVLANVQPNHMVLFGGYGTQPISGQGVLFNLVVHYSNPDLLVLPYTLCIGDFVFDNQAVNTECDVLDIVGIDDAEADTQGLTLSLRNYPNPFNPHTTLAYSIPANAHTSLRIYNAAGQLVRTLVDETKSAGHYEVVWDGRNSNGNSLASGIYFATLESDGEQVQQKMTMLK